MCVFHPDNSLVDECILRVMKLFICHSGQHIIKLFIYLFIYFSFYFIYNYNNYFFFFGEGGEGTGKK